MSMSKPTKMLEFEQRSGFVVDRNKRDADGNETYYVEMLVGGYDADSEEFYGVILDDGPAVGERYSL